MANQNYLKKQPCQLVKRQDKFHRNFKFLLVDNSPHDEHKSAGPRQVNLCSDQ